MSASTVAEHSSKLAQSGPVNADVGFIGPTFIARSPQLDHQDCINLYPELESQAPPSKNVVALIGTPGLELMVTLPQAGYIRGLHVTSTNRLFAVCGSTFLEIYKDWRYKVIGSLTSILNPVGMADNGTQGNQLIIFDGVNGYVYDLKEGTFITCEKNVSHDDALVPWTNACPSGTHVIFKDGWFIANNKNTGKFHLSNLYDGTKWNALNFATAEGSPDNITAVARTNNEIWFFGPQSVEVWYAVATAIPGWVDTAAVPVNTFPFARVPNAFLDFGTEAPYSVATLGNDVFFMGSNTRGHNAIWHMKGYEPERVSNHSIEFLLDSMPRTDDARAFCYQQEGHFFYLINFPTANKTYCYDMTTGQWHERQTYDPVNDIGNMHRGGIHAYWQGMHLVGDISNGNIYQYNLDCFTDNGAPIQRIRSTPHISDKLKRVYHYQFEADLERGTGRIAETDYLGNVTYRSPKAMLSWSDDNGMTFKGERWEEMALRGHYDLRIHWHRLGVSRNRVYKMVISDPIRVILINSFVTMETENS